MTAGHSGSRAPDRVAIVIGSTALGGAERVAATMANAWAERGCQVWLVSTYLHGRAAGYALRPGVSTVFLADVIERESIPRPLATLWKPIALRKVMREIRPDVVVSLLTNVNVLAIAALAGMSFPLIVSERTDPAADRELPRLLRWARVLSYPHADALVVQSAAAALRYAARLPRVAPIEVIHNPLPGELHASLARARQDGEGGVVIGMGSLSPAKRFDRLIKAFAEALGADPAWTLQIWGEGPMRVELARLIGTLQLEGRVRLCGATSRPWVALAAAQIFVLSSEYEGFPNAMLEAMALGLPCIAFDCPSGPRELAGAGAVLVPAADVTRLAAALRLLATDRPARQALGAQAAEHVRQQFAERAVMDDWDRLIARLRRATGGFTDDTCGAA